MKIQYLVAAGLIGLSLAGCDTPTKMLTGEKVDMAGPEPLLTRAQSETINLVGLINAHLTAEKCNAQDMKYDTNPVIEETDANLSKIFALFNACTIQNTEQNERRKKSMRNAIQNRIMMAADRRCAVYKKYLTTVDTNIDFMTGSLSVVLGGTAAMFGGDIGRALGGAAGMIAGIDAEFNKTFFKNAALDIFMSGIDMKMASIHNSQILPNQERETSDYTLEWTIKDTIRYGAACTLSEGFKQIKDSIAGNGEAKSSPGQTYASKIVIEALDRVNDNQLECFAGMVKKDLGNLEIKAGTPEEKKKFRGLLIGAMPKDITLLMEWLSLAGTARTTCVSRKPQ